MTEHSAPSSPGHQLRSHTGVQQLRTLLLVLVPVALLVAWRMPVTYPEGDFVMNVMDVVHHGHVASTFTPDTYPYLAGLAYKAAHIHGFLILQAAVYLLLASCVLWLLRSLAGGVRASLLAALVICLNPDLLSSIPKVWDTGLTCLLMVGFTGICIALSRRMSWARLLVLATVWGFGVSVRPNFALLLLLVLYLLVTAGERAWLSVLLKAACVAGWGFAVFSLMNVVAHGSFYVAQNGPYNLFAGANPYTQASLLRIFNAEGSVRPALAALGVQVSPQNDATYALALRSTYTHYALLFIRSHPLAWLWLGCVKLMTLLRPDTKAHALLSAGGLVKVLTSLCVPLWLVTLAAVRKLESADRLILVIAACYVLPFLLTNADPRFRPALDVLVLCHAASLIVRRFAPAVAQDACRYDGLAAPAPASPVVA